MGWSNETQEIKKKGMEKSSKILLGIIISLVFIIVLIVVLLLYIQINTLKISIDGVIKEDYDVGRLISKVNNNTYVNIEEFAKLVNYEYHAGEYKAFTIEEDKCYVQGPQETASFFLNDNKVCKLPIDEMELDYREFTIKESVREINGKMYASIEAINLAFNVVVSENGKLLEIYTLDYLVKIYDARVKQWGYTGIADQNFENQKSLLYNYLIVKKKDGLYKIIDNNNTKELVSDKYTSIQFTEDTEEFFVTNSLGQVGIINLDGTTKIEPIYESISILDKESDLYIVEKNEKYGVVKSGNITVISPEYDGIGIETEELEENVEKQKQYIILDTLIPVYKNNKYGAFNKEGNIVYSIEYDGFGCNLTTVEVEGTKKVVNPVLAIEKCNGVVVKKADKYGLLDLSGKELVPVAVSSIYKLDNVEDVDSKYFMLYNGEELNVIERLITAGLIEGNNKEESENTINNTVTNNSTITQGNSQNVVSNVSVNNQVIQ